MYFPKPLAFIAATIVFCSFSLPSWAQKNTTVRPSEKTVKTDALQNGNVVDTLDTYDQHIKIILYSDNTWKYFKDNSYLKNDDVFSDSWTDKFPNPYHVAQSNLPEEWTIWVVDTLGDYHCPNKTKVYSPFGYRHGHNHQGVDLPLHTGDPVYSAFDGKVRMAQYYHGYGNLIIIRSANGLETFYAHLSKISVQPDQWVKAGDVIGLGGATGRASGAHLHFETRYMGYAFDPQWLFNFETGELRHRLFTLKKSYFDPRSSYIQGPEDEEAIGKEISDSIAAANAHKPAAEVKASKYHTVRSGDTLYSIAKNNGTTVSKLCSLNKISKKTVLKVGHRIRVK